MKSYYNLITVNNSLIMPNEFVSQGVCWMTDLNLLIKTAKRNFKLR